MPVTLQTLLTVAAFILGPVFAVWMSTLRTARAEGGEEQRLAAVERDMTGIKAGMSRLETDFRRFEELSTSDRRHLSEQIARLTATVEVQNRATAETLASLDRGVRGAARQLATIATRRGNDLSGIMDAESDE